jgi:hypothetical protein
MTPFFYPLYGTSQLSRAKLDRTKEEALMAVTAIKFNIALADLKSLEKYIFLFNYLFVDSESML